MEGEKHDEKMWRAENTMKKCGAPKHDEKMWNVEKHNEMRSILAVLSIVHIISSVFPIVHIISIVLFPQHV